MIDELSLLRGVSWLQVALIAALLTAVSFAGAGLTGLWFNRWPVPKLLRTASSLMGLASIIQLKLSGWFDGAIKVFDDEKRFPNGPPSEIVRRIIDNPDEPMISALKSALFFDSNTGAMLAVTSIGIAIFAAWA